jgi:hypothetical protein
VWVEIFGEPDLAIWNFVYGKDTARVFEVAKMVHDAFTPHAAKIGGLGFACPEQNGVCIPGYIDAFVDFYKANKMSFAFWSFHLYLGWTDATDPSAAPNAFLGRATAFRNILRKRGITAGIVCTEYAWQDGDGEASWGFKEQARSARGSMTDHRSCARTLAAMDIVRGAGALAERAYWAQGVGSTLAAPAGKKWGYAYNCLVIWHHLEKRYRYKASYYAFWMYAKLAAGEGVAVQSKNKKLGVLATKKGVLVYNKSPAPQAVSVSGLRGDAKCVLHLVDAKTFKLSAGGLDAVVSGPTSPTPPAVPGVATVAQALAALKTLGPEATACILLL